MGGRSSICCVGARSTLREQQTHQKLGRASLLHLYVAHLMANLYEIVKSQSGSRMWFRRAASPTGR